MSYGVGSYGVATYGGGDSGGPPVPTTGAFGSAVARLQAMVSPIVWGDPSARSWMQTAALCLGLEIQQAWEAVAWIVKQAYPALADENGLSYWEQLLGVPINPPNLSTDQRREVVLARRHVAGAVQMPRIQALIGQYLRGSTVLIWDARDAILTLVWNDPLGVPANLPDIGRVLDKYLPAWISVQQRFGSLIYQMITDKNEPYSTITASGLTYAGLKADVGSFFAYLLYGQVAATGDTYAHVAADGLTYDRVRTAAPSAL